MNHTQTFASDGTPSGLTQTLGDMGAFEGINLDSLQLKNGNRMFEALLDKVDEKEISLSTGVVFRAHVRRLCLVFFMFIYGWIEAARYTIFKYVDLLCSIALIEWYLGTWFSSVSIIYTTLSKFVQVELVGYTIEKHYVVFPRQMSPYLPKSLGLILHQNEFTGPAPLKVPQPYLNYDKKIVVPSKRQTQEAIMSRNEFFTKKRIHVAAEEIRLLSELTRFVLWVSLLPKRVEFVTIFEPKGSAWKDIKDLEGMRSSLLIELISFNSAGVGFPDKLLPTIELVDCFTGERLQLNDDSECKRAARTFEMLPNSTSFEEVELSCSSGNANNLLTVYLCDDRLQTLGSESLDKFPLTPDLILAANCPWRFKTFGFLPGLSTADVSARGAYFYESKGGLSFKFFIRSLYLFASTIQPDSTTETLVPTPADSINSTNFFRLFLKRMWSLRLFDLNSALQDLPSQAWERIRGSR